ncbi:hypothetical protein HPB48_018604 [Haemaphysalis longicornis]|uniref:Cytochrome P450 n=1 Tax=Haemaphysalis longicornis TaxID=44386 RepID=A0A9J6H203_HAELO|nr:hypothetical protein HPB48_018604 [Haemaphysalis longicornis]
MAGRHAQKNIESSGRSETIYGPRSVQNPPPEQNCVFRERKPGEVFQRARPVYEAASAAVPSLPALAHAQPSGGGGPALADTLQAEVQDENRTTLSGPDRPPRMGRAPQNAPHLWPSPPTIWEMLRWKHHPYYPFHRPREGISERAGADFVSDGIFFPAGVTVMANLWAVHNDPNRWPNPEEFDPTRFLHEDGSATVDRPEHIISFSLGPRKCPAETQAIMLMFLYIVCILQNFRVLPEEGVTIDPGDRLDRLPAKDKYLLRFIPRAKQHGD